MLMLQIFSQINIQMLRVDFLWPVIAQQCWVGNRQLYITIWLYRQLANKMYG